MACALAACAGAIPPPTDADVLRARARWPDTTLATLTDGRMLYIEHCSGCHPLYRPTFYPGAKWPKIVAEMAERSKLDGPKAAELTRYLVIMSVSARSP